MLSDPTKLVGLILGLFAVLGLVAGAIVYLRQTVSDGTIASLERSNKAYKEELEAKELEKVREIAERDAMIADLDKKALAYELKSKEQDRTIDVLTNLKTNTDQVEAIETTLSEHHDASMKALSAIEGNLKKIIIREGDRHGDSRDT